MTSRSSIFSFVFLILSIITPSSLIIVKLIQAADTATVTSTVTVQNISVSVADGSISYGTLAIGSSKSTSELGDSQVATNDGNITETINIKGSNSIGWTLAAVPGVNQYSHKYGVGQSALTINYQTLVTSIGVGQTYRFDLAVYTPTSSSTYTQQSIDVTVQAISP